MRTARTSLALVLAFLIAAGSASAGQQHAVTPQQLAAAMREKVAVENADRAAVREALARPQVRDVAASMPHRAATAGASVAVARCMPNELATSRCSRATACVASATCCGRKTNSSRIVKRSLVYRRRCAGQYTIICRSPDAVLSG